MTPLSLTSILYYLHKEWSFGQYSKFIDIGSGTGKVVATAALVAKPEWSFGIEIQPTNFIQSIQCLANGSPAFKSDNTSIGLICRDLNTLPSLAPFDIAYAFSLGMPPAVLRRILDLASYSRTVRVLMLAVHPLEQQDMEEYIQEKGHCIVARFCGRQLSGCGRRYSIWAITINYVNGRRCPKAEDLGRVDPEIDAIMKKQLGDNVYVYPPIYYKPVLLPEHGTGQRSAKKRANKRLSSKRRRGAARDGDATSSSESSSESEECEA